VSDEDLSRFPGTWAERTPDKPAIVMAESGEVVTYARLDEIANRLSRLFRAAGLRQGDHIAFCLENRAEFLPIIPLGTALGVHGGPGCIVVAAQELA